MIELKNICKTYKDKKKKETKALNNVNYKFQDKGLYFITGKSGSGKSTLLSILSGIDFKFEGDLLIDNKSIKEFTKNDINYYKSTYVGYIFQDYNLIPELNAYENVKLGFDVSSNDDESSIHEIFKDLDIDSLENRNLSELSGGEKQRVAIARCLVKKPKVILADEPTGALDPINSKIIMDTLYKLSKDYLVIVVTHNTNFLDEYESKKLYLDHGNMTTSDIENVTSDETYKSDKYKGLSNKIKLKLGLEILLHKKITLIFSLLFVLLSLLCISISISGFKYDENYTIYKELKKQDDYIVANYNLEDKGRNTNFIKSNALEKAYELNQNIVYGYMLNNNENNYLSHYYYGYNDFKSHFDVQAFEYDEKTIDLFGLEVIVGNEPKNDNELLITDVIAETFIDLDYEDDDNHKIIDSYSDLLGLNLFGYTICGVVKTKNSDEYIDFYNSDFDYENSYDNMIYDSIFEYGCGSAVFTKEKLYDNIPIYFTINDVKINNQIFKYNDTIVSRNTTINNVEYLDGYDENSRGIIANGYNVYELFMGQTFEEKVNEIYGHYIIWGMDSDYSEEELLNMAKENAKDNIISKLKNSLEMVISPNTEFISYLTIRTLQNVIGVSFDLDSEVSFYIDEDNIKGFNELLEYTNVVSIYSSFKDSNRKYINYLINNYKKVDKNNGFNYYLYLVNNRAAHIYDQQNIFDALKIIFGILALIFLLIGIFILYKYIVDSISYKEKDIGVLKSIGVSNRDIFEIFNFQNIFIILISLILSISLQYVGIYYINKIMSSIFDLRHFVISYRITYLNYLSIILIAILTPLIATTYPIFKLSLKNPKDILNNDNN